MILDDDTRIKYIKGDIARYIFNKISLFPMAIIKVKDSNS